RQPASSAPHARKWPLWRLLEPKQKPKHRLSISHALTKKPRSTGLFHFPSRLYVSDAFCAGLGKMLLVPGDAAIGGIDVVLHFAQAVTFTRVAHEDRFSSDVS